jgi:hypothetical protein
VDDAGNRRREAEEDVIKLRPLPKTKTPSGAKSVPATGHLTRTVEITHTPKGGEPVLVKAKTPSVQTIPAEEGQTAQVMVALGLTIPGPARSYMSARVEAGVSLPSEPNVESLRAARAMAKEMIGESIEEDLTDVKAFFNEWSQA